MAFERLESPYERCRRIEQYIHARAFFGNEPYDGMNTRFAVLKATKTQRLALTHLNKLSPVDLRGVLGVKPYQHTKTLALLLSAYCNLYRLEGSVEYRRKYEQCRDILLAKELPGGGIGGSYDYQMRDWIFRKDTISTLGTVLAIKGLMQGYHCFGCEEDAAKALQLAKLIVDRHVVRDHGRVHVLYAAGQSRPVLNVYALAAGALSRVHSVTGESATVALAREILGIVIEEQFANGAWPYVAGDEYDSTQIDFHQGFVLEGLCDYLRAVAQRDEEVEAAVVNGARFYWRELFSPQGVAQFRLRQRYPIDIQNQAEGICGLAESAAFEPEALRHAQAIANWTMSHMCDWRKGCFHYQKWPFFTNRIPYMAWGQASMLAALSRLAVESAGLSEGRP